MLTRRQGEALAALQARLCIEQGVTNERQMAEVAARDRKSALANPYAQVKGEFEVAKLLSEPYLANPLRKHDCSPISDGASAIIIASEKRAQQLAKRPAWIRGFTHICEPQDLGAHHAPELTAHLATALDAAAAPGPTAPRLEPSPEVAEGLRALGYAGPEEED